jgi:hypothetical protein
MAGVALLHTQLPRLIALAGQRGVKPEAVALWQRVLKAAPPMPTGIRRNGKPGLIPYADPYDNESKKTRSRAERILSSVGRRRSALSEPPP